MICRLAMFQRHQHEACVCGAQRTEAVAILGNGKYIVQVSVLVQFAKFQGCLSSNGARNEVEYDAYW